jgi:hypothetical protein
MVLKQAVDVPPVSYQQSKDQKNMPLDSTTVCTLHIPTLPN